jgi:hypothetical protein
MSGRPGPRRPSARQGADVDVDHTRRRTDTTAGTDRAATGTQEGTVAVPPLSTKSAVCVGEDRPRLRLPFAFTLKARTEIAATKAGPIIRALAVAAVPHGSRMALCGAAACPFATNGDRRIALNIRRPDFRGLIETQGCSRASHHQSHVDVGQASKRVASRA